MLQFSFFWGNWTKWRFWDNNWKICLRCSKYGMGFFLFLPLLLILSVPGIAPLSISSVLWVWLCCRTRCALLAPHIPVPVIPCANSKCYHQKQPLMPDLRHALRQWQQWRRFQIVYQIGHTPEVHPQVRCSGWLLHLNSQIPFFTHIFVYTSPDFCLSPV